VEVAERFADGAANGKALQRAHAAALAAAVEAQGRVPHAAARATVWTASSGSSILLVAQSAARSAAFAAAWAAAGHPVRRRSREAQEREEDAQQVLLHDVVLPVGVAFDSSWRQWNGGSLVRLARDVYEDRDFGRLGELAAGLEAAGCSVSAILEHLRGPGPHTPGCFVLDLLVGRE
jgi:hypothetical protein